MSRPRASHALVWRIFLATAAVVAVVLATTMLLVSLVARRAADAALGRGLGQTRRHVAAILDARERSLTSGALVFAQDPYFRTVVMNKDRANLLDRAEEAVARIGATWVQITDADGVRLAKSDDPAAAPAPLGGTALIGGALDGEVMTGAGVAGDTALFQGVAVPIRVGEGRPAGVLMAAWMIDTALANAIKRETASEVVFYLLDTTGAPRVLASTVAPDERLAAFLRGAGETRSSGEAAAARGPARVELGGRHWVGERLPLRTAGGDVLGGVATLRSREAEMAPFDALRDRLAVAGVLGLALAFALSYIVAQRISRPILALADATRRAAAGEYVADVPVRAEGEIGALADAVRSMLGGLRGRQVVAEYLRGAMMDHGPARTPSRSVTPTGGPFATGRVAAGRYEIGEVLGVGGAGVVYKALDRELGETVAIKTLRPDALAGETEVERLRSEIRLARRISHRNVVRTHDIGEVDGVYYITMEYVEGLSLAELLEQGGTLPVPVALSVGEQLSSALAVAHEQGVIHRDIKPQNLILQPDGTLKVMDFGIARLAERTTALTAAGLVVGTPAYMAPEQLLSEEVDARADVYAAGMVLYECLTGRRPYTVDSLSALIGRILTDEPTPPHVANAAVPDALSSLVMRAIARDREQRPPSAAVLQEELVRVGLAVGGGHPGT